MGVEESEKLVGVECRLGGLLSSPDKEPELSPVM